METYLTFVQNLAAFAEKPDIFIKFKKKYISFLLSVARNEEARTEINVLQRALPGDEELASYAKACNFYFTPDA